VLTTVPQNIIAVQQAPGGDVQMGGGNLVKNANDFEYVTYRPNGQLTTGVSTANGSTSIVLKITDGTTDRLTGVLCMGWSGRGRYIKNQVICS
jgi:hypothetical protein